MGKARTLSRRRAHSGASGHSGGSGDSRGEDYWQAPSLTASERAYMIRKAKEASVALVDHAHTLDGPVQWHYTGKFRGIQMYRGEGSYDRVGTTGTEFLCGVTTMMGSIEEVANYFDQQTTERMLAKKADDVLDCEMLYALVQGDHNNPYYRVSAKYQLYEGPSAFSRERDYCFLECQNTFRHASGRRGWVLSMHSIKLPSCPEVDGVVRGSMYQSGYVFVEAEKEGYMDVMHSLQINFKSTSRLPHFLLNSALKRRILSVVTISREIQTTRMGRQTLLRKKDLMPKRARALCVNCSRKFSLFVRKTRCRVCGEVVCQPCAPQVMISTKRGPVKTRVCMRCYHLSSSDEYEPVGALPTSQNGGDPRRMQNETRYSDILQDHHDHPDLYHEEDEDSMEEDGDEDGLEEQSDYSVFAQSRFTDASRDSVATSQFGASRSQFESHFEGSSQFDTSSELDDSQYYDGGASETSFVSGVSGTSTSYWHGGNSGASSMAGWNQASSVKPADGYIYDPQSSMMSSNSNFYGASNYKSEYGGSNHSADDEPKKRAGRYKATAPIPEDEPSSLRGYNISPNTSYNDYRSAQGTNYNSKQVSNFKDTQEFKATQDLKKTQGTKYGSSQSSHKSSTSNDSNTSQASKTVSIQSLAKARSARYGIKSQFPPPPPPPPPLLPPPEEEEEDVEGDSPLQLGALKSDKPQSSKDRKPKGIASRKMFTPPPPRDSRREAGSRLSANRAPKASRQMAFNAAVANRDSRVSQASSRDSKGFSNTRSSAILEQVRRNRCRTLQFTPDSDRSSAVLKSMEEEHLNRMREIERMQELAKEKAARRSMASNGSRSSLQSSTKSSNNGARYHNDRASSKRGSEQPSGSSQRSHSSANSSVGPSPGSPLGPPPGSPPGTPPSMRGRRLPNPNKSFNNQANRSFGGDRSRRTDASSDFGSSRLLSNRSNGAFVKSGARISLAPSAQSEDLVFNSQRSGFRVSKGSNSSSRGRRFGASQSSSNGSKFGGRQLDASQLSSIPISGHPDDLAFDASQLSVDKSKFSSSIAILENPGESPDHVAMMERPSQQSSLSASLLNEDLLDQSSVAEHISSMRARAVYKLPDEEDRPSEELRKRQEEHRKRMEELTKMTANHAVQDNIRDSTSTLGGLHDSSITLTDYSGNRFGDSTISSISSASSVDIDDDEFDFETRPLGRTKRSGTIPFTLEELEQVPDLEDDDEQSEGPDDSETSFRLSEEHANYAYESGEDTKPSYRSSEESVGIDRQSGPVSPAYRPSEESVEREDEMKSGFATPPRSPTKEQKSGFVPPPFRPSDESIEHELVNSAYRPSDELVDHDLKSGLVTPPRSPSKKHSGVVAPSYRPSEESSEHESGFATPPRRSIDEHTSGLVTPRYQSEGSVEQDRESELSNSQHRTSDESVHELEHPSGFVTPSRRQSEESMEYELNQTSGFTTPPRRSSVDSMEQRHEGKSGFTTPPRRSSVESMEQEHEDKSGFTTPPRRSSVESMEQEHEDKSGFASPPRRSSVDSMDQELEQKRGLATPPRRSSVESMEHELEQKSGFTTPPRRSSVESMEYASESEDADQRSSDESMEHKPGHTEAAYHLSDESEPEDAEAAYRSSEEPVAPEMSAPRFSPQSSQLVPGEGGAAVDEFFADSSRVASSGKLAQVDEQQDEDTRSPRDTSDFHGGHTTQEYNQAKAPISNSTTSSTEASEHMVSPRESVVSAIDEELMNRPTNELFEMVRANRLMYSGDGPHSSDMMHDLEASHMRRMDELNRIAVDHLGNRISNLDDDMLGSAFKPGRSMHPGFRNEEEEMQWRSTDVMEEVQTKHQVDMERLRRRIRQLEEECRESIASVLTPEEMDLSEFDSDDDEPSNKFNGSRSFNPQSSFMCASDLSASTISERMSAQDDEMQDEPLPAQILFERIAQLTQLQQEMAEADDDDDEDEYRERIKEQYRVLRSIKANSARQEQESLSAHQDRESLNDESLWI